MHETFLTWKQLEEARYEIFILLTLAIFSSKFQVHKLILQLWPSIFSQLKSPSLHNIKNNYSKNKEDVYNLLAVYLMTHTLVWSKYVG